MTNENEYKELQKEEEELYDELLSFVNKLKKKPLNNFLKVLNNYVDVQIKLESFCNK